MKGVLNYFSQAMLALVMIVVVPAHAQSQEEPSAGAMVADALIARPVLLVTTVAGAGLFVLTYPFSALGGNGEKAAETLVVEPARNTFVRCLGCKRAGYQGK